MAESYRNTLYRESHAGIHNNQCESCGDAATAFELANRIGSADIPDTLFNDSLLTDSLHTDSLHTDSLLNDSIFVDSLHADSAFVDSSLVSNIPTDSLERAIWEHNKAVDDSLALDSKKKKRILKN